MRNVVYVLVALTVLVAAQGRALADEGLDTPYIAPKLMLGFGGGTNVDLDSDSVLGAIDNDADLDPSYGIGVAGVNPMGFFALGGQLSLISWGASPKDSPRNLFLELTALPQVNLALVLFEIYLSVPVGLTVDFADDEAYGPNASVNTGLGWHVGVMLGARVGLGDFGLLAEIGYIHRSFSHEIESSALGETWDIDVKLDQAALNAGVYF